MIVTFCGHSKITDQEKLSNWLDTILSALIEGWASTFYLGGYGDFDQLAAAAVQRQKKKFPYIQSILILAYPNREYDATVYDRAIYPPLADIPPRYAILERNNWMVNESNVVISGVSRNWGGAIKTLEFARSKRKVILQYPGQT